MRPLGFKGRQKKIARCLAIPAPGGAFILYFGGSVLMACRAWTEGGKIAVACFKCSEGCIHLEYANLMMTFTSEQFLAFSEVITETRRILLQEQDQRESLDLDGDTGLLM